MCQIINKKNNFTLTAKRRRRFVLDRKRLHTNQRLWVDAHFIELIF